MKILFLVYHGFSPHSGISKKIHYQVKGLRENGHDVSLCHYGYAEDGHRCCYINDAVVKDFGTGVWAGMQQRIDYDCILDYCINEGIQFVYARCFQNANPWLIRFFRRLRKAGIKAVTEIPTYPYDGEFGNFNWKARLELKIDQLFREKLYREMNALVTFSDEERIFGQRTIRISNGVDFDSIPLHQPPLYLERAGGEALHLIGVAEVHSWHGYDRVMAGLGEYHGNRDIYFHVVGGVSPGRMDTVFTPIINKYRSGITVIKTLKNREYATRGLPFIYSEQDSDFDEQPYVLKAPADESPIDMQQIVDFMDHFTMKPEEIRHTVEHLTWKIQMQRVLDGVASML